MDHDTKLVLMITGFFWTVLTFFLSFRCFLLCSEIRDLRETLRKEQAVRRQAHEMLHRRQKQMETIKNTLR